MTGEWKMKSVTWEGQEMEGCRMSEWNKGKKSKETKKKSEE